jgi:hypothetical protein
MRCILLPTLWVIAVVASFMVKGSIQKEKAFRGAVKVMLTVCI